jgi:hypothetical protein
MKFTGFVFASALLVAGYASPSVAQTASPRVFSPEEETGYAPPVDVWLDQTDYRYGARIRPHFRSEPGAYVTIVRVTTDGQLQILFPSRPGRQKALTVAEVKDDRVPFAGYPAFTVNESSGTGFVFAIASYRRFDYKYYSSGGQWDVFRLASSGRYGDPFEIMRTFVDLTLDDDAEFSMDYATYEVIDGGRRSRYSSRYSFATLDDYYDRCYSAFGLSFSYYCRNYGYYSGYYGPVIGVAPRAPAVAAKSRPSVKPLVPDPVLPHMPREGEAAQGRQAAREPGEAAAYARERMLREMSPRIEMKSGEKAEGANSGGGWWTRRQAEPQSPPRIEREPMRAAPVREPVQREPVQREPVMRSEPVRAEPQAPARVEVRNEPAQAAPARIERAEPRPVKEKDQ